MGTITSRLTLCLLLAGVATTATAQDKIDWNALADVSWQQIDDEDGRQLWKPEFPEAVAKQDGEVIKISGFMIPLGFSDVQTEFLVSAFPGDGCYFHMPGGSESVVYVETPDGTSFTYDVIEVEGTLELLEDDPYGLLYRVVEAKAVKK